MMLEIKKISARIKLINSRLQNQIVASFILMIFIPIMLMLVIMYNIYFNFMSNKVQSYNSQLIRQINTNIDSKLMMYNNLTRQIYSNKDIVEDMKKQYLNNYEKSLIEKSVSDVMVSLINVDKYILSAYVITAGGGVYYNGYGTSIPVGNYDNIVQAALKADGRVVWLPTQKVGLTNNRLAFTAAREIKTKDGAEAGTLVMLLNETFFSDYYKDIDLGYPSSNFIVSTNSDVISSENRSMIGKKLSDDYIREVIKVRNGSFIKEINKQRCLVVFSTSSITDWTFVSVIPIKEMLKDVYSIKNIIFAIIAIFSVFLITLCYQLPKRITKPIKKLSKTIKIVQNGDFNVSIENTNDDEIGDLSRSFNIMVRKLNRLILEVTEKEKEKTRAELQALQSQINPHFMYNTLNSIKFMAVLNKQEGIKNMISALINLLKNAAKNSDELITIEDEVNLLEDYIHIQSVRFGDFNIVYHIPEECKKYKIIKFTLQPIIENSILHGFSERGMFGGINVIVKIIADKLSIIVKDDGAGMSEDTLAELFTKKDDSGYSKMGIKNIHDRIVLNYGNEYGLCVDSVQGCGTTVTAVLPIIQ